MIETGVDRLISLVNEKKKISFKDAAKELAVDISTVKEWSSIMGDEDNVIIEYKFTTPFLVMKGETKKSKAPKNQKIDKLHKEKEEQIKKVEESIGSLNEHQTGIEQAKERISGIKDDLAKHSSELQKQISGLVGGKEEVNPEKLKKFIMQRINAINKKLIEEEQKYEDFANKVKKETDTLNDSFKNMATHLKKTADWINYFKEHDAEQEKRIKELEKGAKKK